MDVSPDKQKLDQVFSHTPYHIDFYQREYKWGEDEVEILLDDIFHKFNLAYKPDREPDEGSVSDYPWYYLNTFVTNQVDGKLFLVDGQQRLTTLTLILIRLYHRCQDAGATKVSKWISEKIVSFSGSGETFWMGAGDREDVLKALYEGEVPDIDPKADLTGANMVDSYEIIAEYLEEELDTERRLKTFVYYFLHRLVMVRLDVDQDDVAMVFEVINDRGIGLKAHEILKGKLLGKIDKSEVDELNDTWERRITPLDAKENADDFFSTHFKAQFANTRNESQRFEGDYHRTIFDEKYNRELGFKNDRRPHKAVARVRDFVTDEIPYYTRLYRRVESLVDEPDEDFLPVYFNGRLNQMDAQVVLIMAACDREDPAEDQKIRAVAREFDRFYVLLQLNKSYDSNQFADAVYEMREDLENAEPEGYREIFEEKLSEIISRRRDTEVEDFLRYTYFSDLGYSDFGQRFIRYLLARVELFLANGIQRDLQDSLYNLVRNDGRVHGYHIEHILGRNDENLELFGGDEEVFERERNRLGGLLLLRGPDNESSGAESYEQKLSTYASTLYWNQSLREDFYKSKLQTRDFVEEEDLDLGPIDEFDPDALEQRTRVLFDIVKRLWV